jgi:hypothetical protein
VPRRDSNSRSNSSMRSFRLAACRSCAGVNCNRSIAAQSRRPYEKATQYFPTRPLVRKPNPRLMSHIPTACRRTPYGANACDYDPAPWPTLILAACRAATGTVTRPRRARGLTTRTSFGTPVTPGGGRLLQRGSPPPPPLTDPAGLFSFEVSGGLPVHTPNTNVGCARGALGTHLRTYGLRGHRETRSGGSRLARAGDKRLAALLTRKTKQTRQQRMPGSRTRASRGRG